MLLSREEYDERIRILSDKVGMDTDSLNVLKELQTDYTDRVNVIEEKDALINASDGTPYKDKYFNLCEEYKNRFFNTSTNGNEIKRGNAKDLHAESDNEGGDLLSYESLFKEREVN